MKGNNAKPLTDDDIMPIGKQFKGKTLMRDVPAKFLKWLDTQELLYPTLREYASIDQALIEQALAKPGGVPCP